MFEQITVGDTFSHSKKISEGDIQRFAEVTGDFNPVHMDSDFAKKTRFKEKIVHGFLTASLISAAIGTGIPGSIYLEQKIRFIKPVKIGDEITAEIRVLNKNFEKRLLVLSTICRNQNHEQVIEGEALILVDELPYHDK